MVKIKKIAILVFTLFNLVELYILGNLFIIYSSYLHIFPWWYETDPIMLIIVWELILVFIFIGAILHLFRRKLPILKTNEIIPFCTIAYLSVTVFLVIEFRNFCIISGCIVIVISFMLIIFTTIISIKRILNYKNKRWT